MQIPSYLDRDLVCRSNRCRDRGAIAYLDTFMPCTLTLLNKASSNLPDDSSQTWDLNKRSKRASVTPASIICSALEASLLSWTIKALRAMLIVFSNTLERTKAADSHSGCGGWGSYWIITFASSKIPPASVTAFVQFVKFFSNAFVAVCLKFNISIPASCTRVTTEDFVVISCWKMFLCKKMK